MDRNLPEYEKLSNYAKRHSLKYNTAYIQYKKGILDNVVKRGNNDAKD